MLAGNFIRTPTELAPRVRTGIDLGGTKIEGIVLGDTGNELARRRVPTPQGDYAATVTAIADLVKALEGEAGGHADHVGVGMPGILSSRSGLVKNANSNCLIGKPLDSDLTTALGRPVRLENDANCFAVSEATDGAGEGAGIVFGAILGTGVGAGIVVNGRPLRGANAIAGEWGHNPLPWPTDAERPGPACYCGRCGCIETFLSGSGLSADHARHGGGALAVPDIVLSSDETARQTLDRYVERLARALSHVINIIDPDVVVLGGGLSNIDRLYEDIPRLWGQWIFSDAVDTALRRNVHGDSSGVRGAAWL